MYRIRYQLLGFASFVIAFLLSLFTPGTWVNRAIAVAMCGTIGICSPGTVSNILQGDRAVAADVPVLVGQRSSEFEDTSSKFTPNPEVPAFPKDAGPNVIRPDFDSSTGVFATGGDTNKISNDTEEWVYSIHGTSPSEMPLVTMPLQLNKEQIKSIIGSQENFDLIESDGLTILSLSSPSDSSIWGLVSDSVLEGEILISLAKKQDGENARVKTIEKLTKSGNPKYDAYRIERDFQKIADMKSHLSYEKLRRQKFLSNPLKAARGYGQKLKPLMSKVNKFAGKTVGPAITIGYGLAVAYWVATEPKKAEICIQHLSCAKLMDPTGLVNKFAKFKDCMQNLTPQCTGELMFETATDMLFDNLSKNNSIEMKDIIEVAGRADDIRENVTNSKELKDRLNSENTSPAPKPQKDPARQSEQCMTCTITSNTISGKRYERASCPANYNLYIRDLGTPSGDFLVGSCICESRSSVQHKCPLINLH
jgi:hypothetical protein